jgi:hypothetical protein
MEKFDFRHDRTDLYAPGTNDFGVVDVPAFEFLMIDGHGDPNTSPDYVSAVEALFTLSYGAKFACKRLGRDYAVLPLEGLWWADDPEAFTAQDKDDWSWTMMIRQPIPLPAATWDELRAAAAKKPLPAVPAVRLESFTEGPCVQIMYLGPYSEEGPTILRLHEWISANGYRESGNHHEIYIGDPRRAKPEKLKTVIRQPIRAV